jgi:chromosome segregation ATPase
MGTKKTKLTLEGMTRRCEQLEKERNELIDQFQGSRVRDLLDEKEKALKEAASDMAEKLVSIGTLKKELDEITSKFHEAHNLLDEKEKALFNQKKEIKTLRSEAKIDRKQLKALNDIIAEKEQALAEKLGEIEELKAANERYATGCAQLEVLRQDNREFQGKVQRLELSEIRLEERAKAAEGKEHQMRKAHTHQEEIIKEFRAKSVLDTETIHTLVEAVKGDSVVVSDLRKELQRLRRDWHAVKKQNSKRRLP